MGQPIDRSMLPSEEALNKLPIEVYKEYLPLRRQINQEALDRLGREQKGYSDRGSLYDLTNKGYSDWRWGVNGSDHVQGWGVEEKKKQHGASASWVPKGDDYPYCPINSVIRQADPTCVAQKTVAAQAQAPRRRSGGGRKIPAAPQPQVDPIVPNIPAAPIDYGYQIKGPSRTPVLFDPSTTLATLQGLTGTADKDLGATYKARDAMSASYQNGVQQLVMATPEYHERVNRYAKTMPYDRAVATALKELSPDNYGSSMAEGAEAQLGMRDYAADLKNATLTGQRVAAQDYGVGAINPGSVREFQSVEGADGSPTFYGVNGAGGFAYKPAFGNYAPGAEALTGGGAARFGNLDLNSGRQEKTSAEKDYLYDIQKLITQNNLRHSGGGGGGMQGLSMNKIKKSLYDLNSMIKNTDDPNAKAILESEYSRLLTIYTNALGGTSNTSTTLDQSVVTPLEMGEQ